MSALRMARRELGEISAGPEMGSDSDATLLEAVGRGDAPAFRRLAAKHLGFTVGLARRLLGSGNDADDVAQEAMLRLWRNAASLELGPGGLKPWLRRVTTNLVIDRIRAGRQTTTVDEMPEQPVAPEQERGFVDRDLSTRVGDALAALPDRQRQALVLFHFEGLSQLDVGKALGISDEAVESLLARGRRSLKAALKDEWRELLPDQQS